MMETIFKFASSTIIFQVQRANSNGGGNTSDITTFPITNTGNGENTSIVPFENTNVINPSINNTSITTAGTSTMLLVPLLG